MQNIRVTCVSMNGFLGEPERSLRNIETFSRKLEEVLRQWVIAEVYHLHPRLVKVRARRSS